MLTATNQHQPLASKADALYERYGKPLEKTHKDSYVAIAEDGRTLIDSSVFSLMQKAKDVLGPGNFIFKIGDRAVGNWL